MKSLLWLAVAVMLGACQAQPELDGTIFEIDNALVDCEGVVPQKCMRVKKGADAEWEYFYDAIDCFEHQEGCSYTLRVKVSAVNNPPADASSLRYVLLEEVARDCGS